MSPMGRRNSRGSFASSGRPHRPMDWYCGDFDGTVATAENKCKWLIKPSQMHALSDPTVMALRMAFIYGIGDAGAATNQSIISFGVIAWNYLSVDGVPDDDPPTDCPSPITQCDADWLWLVDNPFAIGNTGNGGNAFGPESHVSSKARRRLGNDKSLLLVVDAFASGYNFHAHGRVLVKE